jgi:hypothetical protein
MDIQNNIFLILKRADPLLGNGQEIMSVTWAADSQYTGLSNPFLSNSSVNRFLRQRTRKQKHNNGVFCVVRAEKL